MSAEAGGEGFDFLLMRHAESVNNMRQREALFPGAFARVPDPPLTALGERQAQAAAARVIAPQLRPPSGPAPATVEIFTSDMSRAIQTALHVAKGLAAELPSTRVCVVPVPFFSEMGSDTVVREPTAHRFAAAAAECGAHLDASLWREAWGESRALAGDYAACLPLFLSRVMPWIEERCRRRRVRCPIVVGHGQFMRNMLGVWKRFRNAEAARCRFEGGRVSFVDRVVAAGEPAAPGGAAIPAAAPPPPRAARPPPLPPPRKAAGGAL